MEGYRDNSGVLFKNGRKQSEKSPDYVGEITINGRPMELSAWIRDGRKGKFMTLATRPKAGPTPRQQAQDRMVGDALLRQAQQR